MSESVKLTGWSRFSGCGAKLGPQLLDKALCGLSQPALPGVMADYHGSEDAGVFRISDEAALVQTIDFFPPIVDDPLIFGEIAAANALSDIYAMGGTPKTAVSVVCFPDEDLDIRWLRKIMEGGLNKLQEAETALLGGHSVSDRELKFGFAVNGLLSPDRILRNNTPRPGDVLILTKPLGTGAINTALKAEMASDRAVEASCRSMRTLNRRAAEILREEPVSACTDVTGFGLLGHCAEMIGGTDRDLRIFTGELPLLPDVMEYISLGLVPEGTFRNRDFRLSFVGNPEAVSPETLDLLFDPQTSGGLLAALPEKKALEAVAGLEAEGHRAAVIGRVEEGEGRIRLDA